MKTIVIAGSHSNIGKTLVAEELLNWLKGWSGLKVTTVNERSGCARGTNCTVCSELKDDFEIILDKKIINKKDTDTARMKKAGAKKVAWLRASLKGLSRGLKEALDRLKGSEGVVIEGTSVLKYIRPDLVVFLKSRAPSPKTGAREAERKADIIIDC